MSNDNPTDDEEDKTILAEAPSSVNQESTLKAKSTGDEAKSPESKTDPLSPMDRVLNLAKLALGYILALAFLVLHLKGGIEAQRNDSFIKWEIIGAGLLALAWSVFSILKKYPVAELFKVPLALFVGLVAYSAFRFPTSELKAYTLFGQPTEALLNPAFLLALVVILLRLWTSRKLPSWLHVVGTIIIGYSASGFVYGILRNVGLEDSFLGVDFFSKVPFYFLQPAYLAIHVILPLSLLYYGFQWLRLKDKSNWKAKSLSTFLLMVLLINALGFVSMSRNRVPNLLSSLITPELGVGETTTSYKDALGNDVAVTIKTAEFATKKLKEDAEFYNLAMSYASSVENSHNFNLSIKDEAGRDVLFLSTKDFEFYENGILQEDYNVNFELGGVKTGQNMILLLDHSGSMANYINDLQLAAKAFVDLKSRNDKVLIVPFNSKPYPQELTDDTLKLKTQIDTRPSSGGTNLFGAIIEAYSIGEKLEGSTTMVIMTDGQATDKSDANKKALAAKLATKRIRLYSVALGKTKSVDEDFLKNLASSGGGKFFRTENASELRKIYQAIGAELHSKYTANYLHKDPAALLSINTPEDDATVHSPFDAEVEISNLSQAKVVSLTFYVDGQRLAEVNTTKETKYSFKIDPSSLDPGPHVLRAISSSVKGSNVEARKTINVQRPLEFSILRPSQGDSVGGVVPIEASLIFRDSRVLKSVSFSVDGRVIGETSSEPFIVQWDASRYPSGQHTIVATAEFQESASARAQIEVSLRKDVSIRFDSPVDGSELQKTTVLQIGISDEDPNDPVTRIDYFLGDTAIGSAKVAPFSYTWNTESIPAGNHLIRAQAKTRNLNTVNTSLSAKISEGALVLDLKSGATVYPKPKKDAAQFFFPPENVEIILDASNSMWGQLAGGSKIDIAKQVLGNIVRMIPDGTNVALRVYGSESKVRSGNCKDTKLLSPLSPINRANILGKIRNITPRGKTPIAYSLEQAIGDLSTAKGNSLVLLITDGIESCNGDTLNSARSLHQSGINTKLHVIGYDVDDPSIQQSLTQIAGAGGGKFFPASSGAELSDAIVEAVTVEFQVLDSSGKKLLQEKVGPTAHKLRVGKYEVSIALDPPLVLPALQISAGKTQVIDLVEEGKGYRLVPR